MPKQILMEGNHHGHISKNNIVYYGLRGELGFYFDDIFLYSIEHLYHMGNDRLCQVCSSSTSFRSVFYNQLIKLNSERYDPERPLYLNITEKEKKEGYNERTREGNFINSKVVINKGFSYSGYRIPIKIPEINEMTDLLDDIDIINDAQLRFPVSELKTNKVVIIGNDKKGNIKTFRDNAKTWKDHEILLYNRKVDYFSSGLSAKNALRNHAIGKQPITEIYFSTHGTVYAVDFDNPDNNLYTSQDDMKYILDSKDGVKGNEKAFINDFVELVNNGYIAPNVTITFSGCLIGARIIDIKQKINSLKQGDKQREHLSRWIEMNEEKLETKENPNNFAKLLSLKLPKATIIAPMDRNNTTKGIEEPVMYQNGLRWFFGFPDKDHNGNIITGVTGSWKSTLYPMANL